MAGRRRCWCIDDVPGWRADADQHRRHGVQPSAACLSRQVGGPGGGPALPRQHPALLPGQAAGDHERDRSGVAQADRDRAAAAVDDRLPGGHRHRARAAGRGRHAPGARRGAHAHRARDPRHAGAGADGDRAEHRRGAASARDAARPGARAAGTRAGHGAREPRGGAALGLDLRTASRLEGKPLAEALAGLARSFTSDSGVPVQRRGGASPSACRCGRRPSCSGSPRRR